MKKWDIIDWMSYIALGFIVLLCVLYSLFVFVPTYYAYNNHPLGEPPCDRYKDRQVRYLPVRCLSYFNGSQQDINLR